MNFRRSALLVMALLLLPLLSSCVSVLNPTGWAAAAFDGNTVFVTTSKGHLSALNLEGDSATALWTFPDENRDEDKKLDTKAIYGAPVIDGDRLYVATFKEGVFALRKSDGRPIWPAGENQLKFDGDIPGGVALGGENVYFGTTEGHVYALSRSDGSPAAGWEKPRVFGGGVWATPVVSGDTLIVATMDGGLYGLSLADGSEKWKFEASGAIAEVTRINDDYLFVPSINRHAYIIRTADGSVAGDFRAKDWIWTAPAVDQLKVFFGDFGGRIYGLDITAGAVTETWDEPASVKGDRIKAGAAIIQDVVVVVDREPIVWFVSATDGAILNSVPLADAGTVRANVVARDGAAYIATTNGKLFRAEPAARKVVEIQLIGVKK